MPNPLFNQSLISAAQLTPELLSVMFSLADKYQHEVAAKGVLEVLSNKIMASLFFEPAPELGYPLKQLCIVWVVK